MLSKLKKIQSEKSGQKGFTIIEVMIVLAIAGLIILIVLLAVPALQRNARNAAIKNDASALVGAISTYTADNDGAKVTGVSANGLVSGAGGASAQAKLQGSTTVTVVAAVPGAVVPAGTLQVILGKDCAGVASTRASAVFYSIESSTAASIATSNKCVEA